MYREDPQTLGEAMADALSGLARAGQAGSLTPVWTRVAGPQAARSGRPVSFQRGVLRVLAQTAAWADALEAQRPALEERLGRALPGFVQLEVVCREARRTR